MIDRDCSDPDFQISKEELASVLKPIHYVGRSVEQTEEFVREIVGPVLENNQDVLGEKVQLNV